MERIAAIDTTKYKYLPYRNVDHEKMSRFSGHYRLRIATDAGGSQLLPQEAEADELLLTPDGRYWFCKEGIVVDKGKYSIRKWTESFCTEYNKYDTIAGQYTDEIERIEKYYDTSGKSNATIDLYSSTRSKQAFWVIYNEFTIDEEYEPMIFQSFIWRYNLADTECYQFHCPRNLTYWILIDKIF